ncbi:hypothetical protein T484DRAFT_1755098 [Baffinella frigidus]|nr:hypothetical protein T484DRAFT_1755098 [Cryptophyta sp. CCMP2293]
MWESSTEQLPVKSVRFSGDATPQGPVCDTTHLKCKKDTSPPQQTGGEDEEDLSWLDNLPCPQAPASPVAWDKLCYTFNDWCNELTTGLISEMETESNDNQHTEDVSWMDCLECPQAPTSPVKDKKRASENNRENSQLEDRPLKVMRFDTDEMELLDPSTGDDAAADYELVNGRFIEVSGRFRFTAANDPRYTSTDTPSHRDNFNQLLLTEDEWETAQGNNYSRVLGVN